MDESQIKIETSPITGVLNVPTHIATPSETLATNRVMNDFILGRLICNRQYNYFNGATLYDCIDDWTMRWNGYITPTMEAGSNIFLNFTRNLIIGYLSQVAMNPIDPKILAVNKKTNLPNQVFADLLKDLNRYSLYNENAGAKFLSTALEATVKGTAIVYEGYKKTSVKRKTPITSNPQTGKNTTEMVDRIDFDDCFQELCRLEDIYISNPFITDIQAQPFIIWKKTTTYYEAWTEYGKYPNWKYVQPGSFRLLAEPTTFYGQQLYNELQPNQVQILKYYNRKDNLHIIMANNIILYQGVMPFLHGKYPFAKYVFEPFGNDFFWGAGAPFKFMGEQDTENSFVNFMIDKTEGSLKPYGLSSDLDDLIEDDTLAVNKIRKVGDITKWKFDTLPGVSAGESNMFEMFQNMIKENSGINISPNYGNAGSHLTARQVLLMQQQQVQKLQYNIQFLEDGERDRTELRLKNILQFYSIPKIEKITGKNGKEFEDLVYKEVAIHDTQLSDGQKGTKIIKLVDTEGMDDNERMKLENELSVKEVMGEMQGTPTEAIAIPISMFDNNGFDLKVQVVKNSSYTKNHAVDQAEAMDYAKWRIEMSQLGVPTDMAELVKYVDETFDIDTDRFTPQQQSGPGGQPGIPGQQPGQPPQPQQAPQPGQMPQPGAGAPQPQPAMAPGGMPNMEGLMK